MADDYPKTCLTDALLAPQDCAPSNSIGTVNRTWKLALLNDLFWPNGMRLKTWEKYANIDFQFVKDGDAEIRVGFKWEDNGGSWSYLGNSCLRVGKVKPTMNYGWFDEKTREEDFSRTVTHEFGHALGCVHEHQSPASTIKWNEAKVIADSEYNWKWNEAKTRHNIIRRYQASQTTNSQFDRKSIMCYFYPADWTLDGQGTPRNTALSENDKAFISKMYPFRTRSSGKFSVSEIRPGTPAVALNSRVQFNPTYIEAPKLVLGLNELDMDCEANIRIKIHTDQIEKRNGKEFKLNIDSWSDSVLYGAGATWLDFAAKKDDFQTGEFDTLTQRTIGQVPTPDKEGVRRDVKKFDFPPDTYSQPPTVVVWLKALDLSKDTNWRIRAVARNVTAKSFELSIESRCDTRVFSAAASWVAYPKGRGGVYSGGVSSGDHRPWFRPSSDNGGKVKFPAAFDREPQVFAALSDIDIDKAKNMRIKAFVDTVSNGEFAWHANAWHDTVVYSVSLNWIAFG